MRAAEAEGLAGVELGKVDGLGHVAVGFGPSLAGFENAPGVQLIAALAHEARDLEEARRATFGRLVLPALEGLVGYLNGLPRLLG